MNITSLLYIIFLLIVFLMYYIIEPKYRTWILLAASIGFYNSCDRYGLIMLFITIIISYLISRLIVRIGKNKPYIAKLLLIVEIIAVVGSFIYYKYLHFITNIFTRIADQPNSSMLTDTFFTSIVIPLGMSFFLLQELGYVIDVYKNKIEPENNFFTFMLYIMFFPKIAAGPIEKASKFIPQLHSLHKFDYEMVRDGVLRILLGFCIKLVLADNIAAIINPVYENYSQYSGITVLTAVLLYSLQIYCDFWGYSEIAVGSAKLFGYELIENFNAPYMCNNITDFWRRWHISLTSWFRDYIYIPLGGNRKGKLRKYTNILIVFSISGIWHGAALNYIAWGMINGLLQVLEDIFKNIKLKRIFPYKGLSSKVFRHVIAYITISFTWIFFRASSGKEALRIITWIITNCHFRDILSTSYFNLWSGTQNFVIMTLLIAFVWILDYLTNKNTNFRTWLYKQDVVFRWCIYLLMIFILVTFGMYGDNNGQTQFIYFQF